jgi:hypothetical protein
MTPTNSSRGFAGTRLAMIGPKGAASTPPISSPTVACVITSNPSENENVTDMATVRRNSALLNVPNPASWVTAHDPAHYRGFTGSMGLPSGGVALIT